FSPNKLHPRGRPRPPPRNPHPPPHPPPPPPPPPTPPPPPPRAPRPRPPPPPPAHPPRPPPRPPPPPPPPAHPHRRPPPCRARGQQLVGMKTPQRHAQPLPEAAPGQHQRGADLNRRTFTPGRSAGRQTQEGKRNLPQRLAQRHQARLRRPGRHRQRADYLRNAAARRIGRKPDGGPAQQGKRRRNQDECRPTVIGHPGAVPLQRQIGQLGKSQRDQRHQRGAAQQQHQGHALARQPPGLARLAARNDKQTRRH